MNKLNKIDLALSISKHHHKGQLRDNNTDFFTDHILTVLEICNRCLPQALVDRREEIIQLACLHDILEDTDINPELLRENFGEQILNYVLILTKFKLQPDATQEQKYDQNNAYLQVVAENELTAYVKLADRISNLISTTSDVVDLKPEKIARYTREVDDLFLPMCDKYDYRQMKHLLIVQNNRLKELLNKQA